MFIQVGDGDANSLSAQTSVTSDQVHYLQGVNSQKVIIMYQETSFLTGLATYPLYEHQNALDSLELQGEALCQQVRVAEANIYVALPCARFCSKCLIHLLSSFIIYLFFAALGLHCCTWAFSSCSEQGFSLVEVHRLLIAVASLVVEHGI